MLGFFVFKKASIILGWVTRDMMKERIVKKIGTKLIEISEDIILDQGVSEAKQILDKKQEERLLELYKKNLDEELLRKHGDELFYDDLCRVLLRNNNLDTLLKRCKKRDLFECETDKQFIKRIMDEFPIDIYSKSTVERILDHISETAFNCFNQLEELENRKLANILLKDGEKTRNEFLEIKDECKKIQEKLSNINEEDTHGVVHITSGCKTPVKHFMGREDDIEKIEKIIEIGYKNNEKTDIWIYGMGGMGKTQLCRKLYSVFESKYQYMGWIVYQKDFRHSLVNSVNQSEKIEDLDKEYKKILVT